MLFDPGLVLQQPNYTHLKYKYKLYSTEKVNPVTKQIICSRFSYLCLE